MEVEAEINRKRELENHLLNFIENEDDEENFQLLTKFIEDNNICKNKEDIYDLLQIILAISNEHHREINFFNKIIQIINQHLPNIQMFYSNQDIYTIFQSNRILILNLIQNKVITFSQEIFKLINKYNYSTFSSDFTYKSTNKQNPYKYCLLYLYFKSINNETQKKEIESEIISKFNMDLDTFQLLCQNGENESDISYLIRQDQINEFIVYVNEKNLNLNSEMPDSLFESNNFLLKNKANLIEYAAFFGSITIFKYLHMNKVRQRQKLAEFAVHGRNPEIIHLAEEVLNKNDAPRPSFSPRSNNFYPMDLFFEAVKCYHNDIAYYIEQNYITNGIDYSSKNTKDFIRISYNYEFLPTDFNTLFSLRLNNGGSGLLRNTRLDIFHSFSMLQKITIPETSTNISDFAFNDFRLLKEVFIPPSVTSIGKDVFLGCISLAQITIPSSVTSIGNKAFSGCSSLTQIKIPSSVNFIGSFCFEGCTSLVQALNESTITLINAGLFQKCSSLKEVLIPSSVKIIKSSAFNECKSLEKIELPCSLETIETGVFNKCSSLKEISIPSSVKLIGSQSHYSIPLPNTSGVFNQCSSLLEVTIHSGVLRIEDCCFYECSSLEKITFINSFLTSIGMKAFKGCKSLQEIQIPSTVKTINDSCFEGCASLKQITIPESVTYISANCFKDCSLLKEIAIHPSITSINAGAFEQCTSLTHIELPSSVNSIGDFAFNGCKSLTKITINSPIKLINNGVFNGCSSLVEFTIPTSVTDIYQNAFRDCSSLQHFKIPSLLTQIKDNCFEGCKSLKEIVIPSSITSIKNCSFKDCTSITEITIPSSIKQIESSTFKGCTSLKQIHILSLLTEIEDRCFEGCTSLESITLPSSLISIGDASFKDCKSLTKIEVPSSVTKIGENCFEGCSSLAQISLSSSLTEIKECLFKGCTSIVSFNFPSLITSIRYCAFKGCTSLVDVSIPSSITVIEDSVFNGCKSLVKISIPSSITKISDLMFSNCSSLMEVEIPSSLTEIGNFSFYKCSSLAKITIPSSVTKIGDFAFSGCTLLSSSTFPFPVSTTPIEIKGNNSSINRKDNENETIENYIRDRKEIYQSILNYLESPEDKIEDLIKLTILFNEKNIINNTFDLIELLNLLSKISNYHFRTALLIRKVGKILNIYEEEIKDQLTDKKIVQIFIKNQRILLYFLKKNLIKIDQSFLNNIDDDLKSSLLPEILHMKNQSINEFFKDDFIKTRQINENNTIICQLIRNDSLDEFTSYVINEYNKKEEINKNMNIQRIDQKNPFESSIPIPTLNTSYIEYAAYYGSVKIFKYLLDNTSIKNPYDLWRSAIHSNNLEIIHLLENKNIKPSNSQFNYFTPNRCYEYAIQCHHHEIAKYIKTNYEITTDYLESLKYSNYEFIDEFYNNYKQKNIDLLYQLCSFDFPRFAQILIETKNINISQLDNQYTLSKKQSFNNHKSDMKVIIGKTISSCKEIFDYFFEKGVRIEFDIDDLFKAISSEDIELVKMILCQSNIDINEIYHGAFNVGDGYVDCLTPLFLAISLNHPSIDVNLKFVPIGNRTTKWTALHHAILYENIPIIKLLLDVPNIDVNDIANFDETTYRFRNWCSDEHFDHYYAPLHEAIELDNIEIVKLLLSHPQILVNKIEIYDTYSRNYKSEFQRVKQTSLCRAIQKNDVELVNLLLEQPNIDVNKLAILYPNTSHGNYDENTEIDEIGNAVQKSPLQFAHEFGFTKIIELLENRSDIKKIEVNKKENEEEEEHNDEAIDAYSFIEYITK